MKIIGLHHLQRKKERKKHQYVPCPMVPIFTCGLSRINFFAAAGGAKHRC